MNFRQISKSLSAMGLVSAISVLLVACGGETQTTTTQVQPVTVKVAYATDVPNYSEFEFPAEVSAVKTVAVSFEVAGRLQSTNLRTGSLVKKGELLAQIDPTQFQQRLNEAQTRFEQAKRDLDRINSTFEKGSTSQSQLDNAKTAFELATIALKKTKQDLSYTELRAPFDAQISQRFVDNNSFVRAGDIIANLQDVSRFHFNFNVPERLLTGHQQGTEINADASIISAPEKKYQLEYVEHATQPDPVTQTYKVVFAAETTDPSLTPGARAKVHLKLGYQKFGDGVLIPLSALVGEQAKGFSVWKFEPEQQVVRSRKVNVLALKDQFALVDGEIAIGDQIVSAGAAKMRDGLKVKPYRAEQK